MSSKVNLSDWDRRANSSRKNGQIAHSRKRRNITIWMLVYTKVNNMNGVQDTVMDEMD